LEQYHVPSFKSDKSEFSITHPMKSILILFIVCCLGLPIHAAERVKDLISSYSMLWNLIDKEKDLDKVLLIKDASPAVEKRLKAITVAFVRLQEGWPGAGLPDPDGLPELERVLPTAEYATRLSMEKAATRAILAARGKKFEWEILMSQEKGLGYAAHLLRNLEQQETNGKRRGFLRKQAEIMKMLHRQVLDDLWSHDDWTSK
jgi:hypothetical protein